MQLEDKLRALEPGFYIAKYNKHRWIGNPFRDAADFILLEVTARKDGTGKVLKTTDDSPSGVARLPWPFLEWDEITPASEHILNDPDARENLSTVQYTHWDSDNPDLRAKVFMPYRS